MKKIPQSGTYGKFTNAEPSLYLFPYQRAAIERLTASGRESLYTKIQSWIAETPGTPWQSAFTQQIMTGSSVQQIDESAPFRLCTDDTRRFATLKREGNRTLIDIESFKHPGWSNIGIGDLYHLRAMFDEQPANPILKRSVVAVRCAWRIAHIQNEGNKS